jgi:hypothetical protein
MSNLERNMLVEQLQTLPWFKEPTSAEIDGACFHAHPEFNALDAGGKAAIREQSVRWLRAWKAQANARWLEAEPMPQYRRRDQRKSNR